MRESLQTHMGMSAATTLSPRNDAQAEADLEAQLVQADDGNAF